MKFYKSKDNAVYAYEDNLEKNFIPNDLVEISETEAMSIANPPPSKEDFMLLAEQEKSKLMNEASRWISVLNDAVELDMSTPEETETLLAWKKYRVLLNRVDTSAPVWPTVPSV